MQGCSCVTGKREREQSRGVRSVRGNGHNALSFSSRPGRFGTLRLFIHQRNGWLLPRKTAASPVPTTTEAMVERQDGSRVQRRLTADGTPSTPPMAFTVLEIRSSTAGQALPQGAAPVFAQRSASDEKQMHLHVRGAYFETLHQRNMWSSAERSQNAWLTTNAPRARTMRSLYFRKSTLRPGNCQHMGSPFE